MVIIRIGTFCLVLVLNRGGNGCGGQISAHMSPAIGPPDSVIRVVTRRFTATLWRLKTALNLVTLFPVDAPETMGCLKPMASRPRRGASPTRYRQFEMLIECLSIYPQRLPGMNPAAKVRAHA